MIKHIVVILPFLLAHSAAHARTCYQTPNVPPSPGMTFALGDATGPGMRLLPQWSDQSTSCAVATTQAACQTWIGCSWGQPDIFSTFRCMGTTTRPGINVLFGPACTGCHQVGANRYASCGACHSTTPSAPQVAYPDWLNFTVKSNLLRASYYTPGKTKAEASITRVLDGTMPPGAHPGSLLKCANSPGYNSAYYCGLKPGCTWDGSNCLNPVGSEENVGWCDEIQNVYIQWINAGFPE